MGLVIYAQADVDVVARQSDRIVSHMMPPNCGLDNHHSTYPLLLHRAQPHLFNLTHHPHLRFPKQAEPTWAGFAATTPLGRLVRRGLPSPRHRCRRPHRTARTRGTSRPLPGRALQRPRGRVPTPAAPRPRRRKIVACLTTADAWLGAPAGP